MQDRDSDKKIFGFKRNIFFLGLTSFFMDISSEIVYPLIPIFLTSIIGAPVAFVGLIEGIAESTASLLKVFSGWFSDRIRKRKGLAVFGYSLSALTKPLLAFSSLWWHVLAARFTDRLGKGIRTSPRDALIADSSDQKEYGKSFGFHRTMDTLGAALGPLIAFLLLPLLNNNFRTLFLIAVIPAIFSVLVLSVFVKEKRRMRKNGKIKLSLKPFSRNFKYFLLTVVVFTIGNSSDAFLILRAQNVGITVTMIPLVYLLFNLVYAFSATAIGHLSDKIGRKTVIVSGFIIFSLVYIGFALAENTLTIWLLFAFYGLYYSFTEGIFKAFTADLVEEKLRGTAYGFLNLFLGIGLFPASLTAGFLWQNISPQAPFFFGSAMSFFALVLFLILMPEH